MSVGVRLFVAPVREHLGFLPSRAQLAELVRALAAEGWLAPETEARVEVSATGDGYATVVISELASAMAERLEGHGSVSGECETRADNTYQVGLLLADHLCTIPGDMSGTTIDCPACGKDIFWEPEDVETQTRNPYFRTPVQCPHCQTTLPHASLVARTKLGGEVVEDEAPFYRLAVQLILIDAPDREGILEADPNLLALLERVCGVAFRSFERWG